MTLDELAAISYDTIQCYPGNRGRWTVTGDGTKRRHRSAALAVATRVIEECKAVIESRAQMHGEIDESRTEKQRFNDYRMESECRACVSRLEDVLLSLKALLILVPGTLFLAHLIVNV